LALYGIPLTKLGVAGNLACRRAFQPAGRPLGSRHETRTLRRVEEGRRAGFFLTTCASVVICPSAAARGAKLKAAGISLKACGFAYPYY